MDNHTTVRQVGIQTMLNVVAMIARQVVLLPLTLVFSVVIARLLSPADFGVFAAANFALGLVAIFGNLGLAAAIIQQKEEPTLPLLRAIFLAQLVLSLFTAIMAFILSPLLSSVLHMGEASVWLLRFLSLSLVISSLGFISNTLLEREMAFTKIAVIETLGVASYQILTMVSAWRGLGVWSFGVGIVTGSIVRTFLSFWFRSWKIGCYWDWGMVKKQLVFGGFFQGGILTSLARDNISVLLGGPLFGPAAVGFLNWASRTSALFSQVITGIVGRVIFPALSRLQSDPEGLGKLFEKTLRYVMILTLPWLAIIWGLGPSFVETVFSSKWLPAVPALYLLCIRMVGGNFTTTIVPLLNAVGKVRKTFAIQICWTLFDWLCILAFIPFWGFTGIAAGYALGVLLPAFWLVIELKNHAQYSLRFAVINPLLSTGAMIFIMRFIKFSLNSKYLDIMIVGFVGIIIFFMSLIILEKGLIIKDMITLYKEIMIRYSKKIATQEV